MRYPTGAEGGARSSGRLSVDAARIVIEVLQYYGYVGLAVAAAFLLYGIERVDEGARRSYAFRPLLIPGCIVLWPLVIVRWVAAERQRG